MTDPLRKSLAEIDLLKKGLENLGDTLVNERLERKAEVDKLRLQLEAIRRTLERHLPDFVAQYEKTYRDLVQYYDPESSQDLKKPPRSATA
jgi:hypothetical protein